MEEKRDARALAISSRGEDGRTSPRLWGLPNSRTSGYEETETLSYTRDRRLIADVTVAMPNQLDSRRKTRDDGICYYTVTYKIGDQLITDG